MGEVIDFEAVLLASNLPAEAAPLVPARANGARKGGCGCKKRKAGILLALGTAGLIGFGLATVLRK